MFLWSYRYAQEHPGSRGLNLNRTEEQKYCFQGGLLIASKKSEDDRKQPALNCLKILDEENFRMNVPKSQFKKIEINWLDYNISQTGILPIESMTSAIMSLDAPKSLNKFRFFLGSVH